MRIAICDDNKRDCERLQSYCEGSKELFNIKYTTFLSGDELLASFENGQRFDIVFLDVDMPGRSGIDTGKTIRQYDKNVIIVFVTSYSEFALDAFECEAFHYLIKPCDPAKLDDVLKRAAGRFGIQNRYHVVKVGTQKCRFLISELYYVEYCQKHVIYHLKGEDIEATDKLSNVYDILSKYGFYQVHQGYIVNLEKIKRFEKFDIILDDDRKVSMSVRKRKNVMLVYSKYIERFT